MRNRKFSSQISREFVLVAQLIKLNELGLQVVIYLTNIKQIVIDNSCGPFVLLLLYAMGCCLESSLLR